MSYGIRTEHVIIYLLLPIVLIVYMMRSERIVLPQSLMIILSTMMFITLVTTIVTVFGENNYVSLIKVIASIENYMQPITIILIMLVLVKPRTAGSAITLLDSVCRTFIIFLVLNTFFIVASYLYDLTHIIKYFAAPSEEGISVAQLALKGFRYSGIFNQPFESGISYTLGIFSWVYLKCKKNENISIDYIILILLIVGGTFSISKAFLIGGIPLFIIYWILASKKQLKIDWRFMVFGIVGISTMIWIFAEWRGLQSLSRLYILNSNTNLIQLYTGNRFGVADTDVKALFTTVWNISPIYGLGFASKRTLDNAYLEIFVQGGLISLIGYLAILLNMGLQSVTRKHRKSNEGKLLLILFVYIVGAGVGAPVLTINRFSTVCWVMIILIYKVFELQSVGEYNIIRNNP